MEIACIPHGPFTVAMARAAGLSRAKLRRAQEQGLVRRVLHGVYLRVDVSMTLDVRLAAATLVVNRHSVVCDRTAAWIWGVDVHEFRELDVLPAVESCVLRGHDPTDRAEVRGGSRDLLPSDWVDVSGLRVTTPLRTALDLGCRLPRRQALAAMDALMRAHAFTHAAMTGTLPRYFRRRGVVQLRDLVPLVDPRAESPPESWTRLEMLDHGLPVPELQFWVVIDGVPTYRLDLAYPHARVAIEYDGEEFHSSAEARARDAERRNWLREFGWTVIVIDRSAFARGADEAWIYQIHEALRDARSAVRRSGVRTW